MPKTKISEFSATPANNTDIDSINIAEGCAPSGINDAIRELMAQLKDFQTGAVGDSFNGPVGTSTAAAGAFTTLAASGAVTLSGGTANGVTYLNGSKVLTSGSALTFDGTGTLSIPAGSGVGSYTSFRGNGVAAGAEFLVGQAGSSPTSYVFNRGNGAVVFGVNNAEQMRIDTTGLGIGTSSPSARLHISGTTDATQRIIVNGTGNYSSIKLQYNGTEIAQFQNYQNSEVSIGSTASAPLYLVTNNTTKATITSAGNFGIGTTSPRTTLDVNGSAYIAGGGQLQITGSAGSTGLQLIGQDAAESTIGTLGSQALVFRTGSTERARITSGGDLFLGDTSASSSSRIWIKGDLVSQNGIGMKSTATTGTAYFQYMIYNATAVGQITSTGTVCLFTSVSDYRLKNTVAPMTGALAKVAQLKPVTYKWNADGSDGQGFIAHELAEVCPDAVVGEKDAVDADGNPKYQGIDTSFLVATLTAALQELNTKFDAYVASHP